jgi:sugar phosphate isomerase/epimerase
MKHILDRISYHAVYDASILEALEYAHTNGFAGIQVAVESPHLSFESLSHWQIKRIRNYIETKHVYLTFHGPDEVASLFTHSKYLNRGLIDYYRVMFNFAAQVKARLLTIHLGSPVTFRADVKPELAVPEEDLSIYRKVAQTNLDTLVELAANRFPICVENYIVNEFNINVLKPYLRKGTLSLCWDIAKSWQKPEIEQFLISNLQSVKQVHLHDIRRDNKGYVQSHCVIGSGELDFKPYLEKLAKVDILDYCIEVRPREKAKASLEVLKTLL